ncbi:MAG: ATP-binding cassette domain-containing protein [Gemmatimonadetes bacterium]|nr:ATP-binding cassette domain-containing protein [Gemmatimonadota bacterium]
MEIMTSTSNFLSPASDYREQTPVLQINALRKSYGKLVAVQNASFTVYPQQVFCLVGPNGAGKTSIIDCIVGLKKPDSGGIDLFGERIPDLRRRKDIRSRIGIQFQEDSLYYDIRVREALHLYAKMYQNPIDPDELIDIFELQRQQKTAYKDLSGGERRRLLIAIALVGKPALLILDEPSSNLDPHLRRQLWDVLNHYRNRGLTIVMTTHNMKEAQQYSDVVCVVNQGEIIASGSVPQLLEQFQLNLKVEVETEVDPETLADCPGVTHVDGNSQGVSIYGKDEAFREAVIDRLNSLNIHQFSVKTADLEDVYLFATGSRYMRYSQKDTKNDQSIESEAPFVEGKQLLQQALDSSNPDQLYEAQKLFDRARQDGHHEEFALYYLALCEYRLATLFAATPGEQAESINRTIEHLKGAIELEDNFSDSHALLASAYGQKLGLKPHLGMALGPETKRVLEKSKRLDGNNPRVVLIDGMSDYYTPAMFGGDKQRAISKMEHALELFAKEEIRDPLQPSWGYDEACAQLGIMRQEAGDIEGAREAFVKALEVNPNNGWVKSQLLPGLDS